MRELSFVEVSEGLKDALVGYAEGCALLSGRALPKFVRADLGTLIEVERNAVWRIAAAIQNAAQFGDFCLNDRKRADSCTEIVETLTHIFQHWAADSGIAWPLEPMDEYRRYHLEHTGQIVAFNTDEGSFGLAIQLNQLLGEFAAKIADVMEPMIEMIEDAD